jgi:hypothetical protein
MTGRSSALATILGVPAAHLPVGTSRALSSGEHGHASPWPLGSSADTGPN